MTFLLCLCFPCQVIAGLAPVSTDEEDEESGEEEVEESNDGGEDGGRSDNGDRLVDSSSGSDISSSSSGDSGGGSTPQGSGVAQRRRPELPRHERRERRHYKPYLCAQDALGAPVTSDSFVVAGTCSASLYGVCEANFRAGMDPEELWQVGIHTHTHTHTHAHAAETE